MNKSSDDLVAEEDEYMDNVENRDLQSLIELRYVHDGQKQYATKDDVAIRIFEGIELLPSKSISFIASKDKGYIEYRCSQKIIDDNLYNVAKDYCSKRKTLQNNTFEVISEEDEESISDIPFVMAVKRGKLTYIGQYVTPIQCRR